MTRRKGERPVEHAPQPWSADHPVAHAIATGSNWLDAWIMQVATPLDALTRLTGIAPARLWALIEDAPVTRAELVLLAAVWRVSPEDLAASLPDPARLTD